MATKQKVYSVTVEIKLTLYAPSRGDALLRATEIARRVDEIDTLRVTEVFCPAEGR